MLQFNFSSLEEKQESLEHSFGGRAGVGSSGNVVRAWE